jgi:antitoxin VapB
MQDDADGRYREVSVFRNGRSQAIRIPKEFEFSSEKVIMRHDPDGSIHLFPKGKPNTLLGLLDWLKEQEPLEDFPGKPDDDDLLPLDDIEL